MSKPYPPVFTYEFSADINPVPWKAPGLGTKRMGPRVVPTTHPNTEMKTYQSALREVLEDQWPYNPITGPVHLEWSFARRLGRYTTPEGRTVQKKACDLSNLVKSSEDAIQPWLIFNDVQVMSFGAQWIEQSKTTEGKVLLLVRMLEEMSCDESSASAENLSPEPTTDSWQVSSSNTPTRTRWS